MTRIGIIGAGHGERVLVPAFRAHAGCEIAAIATRDESRAAAAAARCGIPRWSGNWGDIVADKSIDLIAIAVPPAAQHDIAIAAMAAGKKILCEKPIAATLAAARNMAETARRKAAASAVDFILPELAPWRALRDILRRNSIGRIERVDLRWTVETRANRDRLDSWKAREAEGGGTLGNFGSHIFHYLEWLFGPIAEVLAVLERAPDDPRPGDTAIRLDVGFASGAAGSVFCDAAARGEKTHYLSVLGQNGTLILENAAEDYARGFVLCRSDRGQSDRHVLFAAEPEGEPGGDGRIAATSSLIGRFLGKDPASAQMEVDRVPDLNEGLRVQCLIDLARRSHETGCRLRVSEPSS